MSELIHVENGQGGFQWRLLATVSAATLMAAMYNANQAEAQDSDRPTVWIELGGLMQHVGGQGDAFVPSFLAANPDSSVLQPTTPLQAQRPVPFSFGEDGKITIQPEGSDWQFAASVSYGRSSTLKHVDHQTNRVFTKYTGYVTDLERFAYTKVHRKQSDAIVDFSAGKDVGLGLFGKNTSSVLSLGVRFAQFSSRETFDVRARPDLHLQYKYPATYSGLHFLPLHSFHNYHATGSAARSFHGIGPSITWNATVPILGTVEDGEVTVNWGANAAVLFGRQLTHAQHQESGQFNAGGKSYVSQYQHPVAGHDTNRTVAVPNIGGSVGASFRLQSFKVNFGYRADFFFGAIDGGIDTRKSETLSFYGPFASISIGLGG